MIRLWLGVRLLRLAVYVLAPTGRYYILPRDRLPEWLDEYLEYLEAVHYQECATHRSKSNGRATDG